MRNLRMKKILGVLVLGSMIVVSSTTVYAADPYMNCGSKSAHVNVKKYSDK